ncbi:MAG: MgtC/SapB family protein [Alphaproteobacteria bacterium]|nr:MgtC/SapB family protein [Alphaproteobacteria bacterium]
MNWLASNWNDLLPSPWSSAALTLVSIFCGAIVGIERERKEKSAGLRTMILISAGSTVFTLASFVLAGNQGDHGHVAAQIVNGIGFLGAGAILRGTYGVRGMTTAATIWAVAAMGMVVGTGYAGAGLGLAGLILTVLVSATALDNRYLGPCKLAQVLVSYDAMGGKTSVKLDRILDDHRIAKQVRKTQSLEDGSFQLRLTYCNVHKHHKEFLPQIAEMPEVREIRKEAHPS